jgi:hypothetical protein
MADIVEDEIQPGDHAKIAAVDRIDSAHPTLGQLKQIEDRMKSAPTSMPISRNCLTTFHAKRASGKRPLNQIWWVVMHCTQGSTARAAASWFQNPNSQGSAHSCCDDNECYATLRDNEIPWGAPGANYHGYHIEQAGFVSYTKVIWSTKHRKTLQRAAYRAAVRCVRYNIPVRWVDAKAMRAGQRGITSHWECTKAFGGDHTDPGRFWPRLLFLSYVRGYVKGISSQSRTLAALDEMS